MNKENKSKLWKKINDNFLDFDKTSIKKIKSKLFNEGIRVRV